MSSRFPPGVREDLLTALSRMGAAGQAETEAEESFRKRYLPVSEHARAFDPDVVLVVGDRGSGKSELFRAVFSLGLLPTISTHVSGVRLQPLKPQATIWRKGYPVGADFPDASGQRRFAGKADSVGQVEELWFAYLVRTVADLLRPEDRAAMSALIDLPGGDADRCYRTFHQLEAQPLLALDALDRQLVKEDRWIFVGYDELDTLGGYDWHVTNAMIRGLTSFWASYARRWVRLRAKLFVRSDLYRRSTETVGADIAKLAANRAELSWSDKNMYAMLVKRIANSDERLYELCVKARISFNRDDRLAYVPTLQSAEDARQLINTLCQQYMGTNSNKGITFRWVLDHVRDGRKKAHPRSFVRLIERAAEQELNQPRAESRQLLHPVSLRRALDVVSRDHVNQAQTSEWRWLAGIRDRLAGEEMPQPRRQIENALRKEWERSWGQNDDVRPPASDASELVDYLLEVGVLRARSSVLREVFPAADGSGIARRRSQGRIDAPDLYLAGLEMKRKGGVKRR